MHEYEANTTGVQRVDISDHAVLRWLARVDPTEQSPRTAIREAWRRGRRAAVDRGRGRRHGDAVLVEAGGTITTVLRGDLP
jgi:hypothetical protein